MPTASELVGEIRALLASQQEHQALSERLHREAAVEIERLEAENARLTNLLRKDDNTFLIAFESGDHQRLSRAVGRLEAQRDKLAEALKPFAFEGLSCGSGSYIRVSIPGYALDRARAALAALEPSP